MTQDRSGDAVATSMTLAVIACFSVGQFGSNLAPFLLTAIEERGTLSPSTASFLMSAEFGGLLLATLVFWRYGSRWPVGVVARLGVFAYAAGALATALSSDALCIAVARTLCGLGSGAALAAANAAVASQASFDSLISRAIAGSTLVAFLLYTVVPTVHEWHGAGAIFFLLAGCGAVLAIPAAKLARGSRAHQASAALGQTPVASSAPKVPARALLTAAFLMSAGLFARMNDSLSWTFNARYADKAGVDAQLLGVILGVLTLVCAAAPFVSGWLSRRFGYAPTFLGMVIVKVVASVGLYYAVSAPAFVLCQALMFFTFVITMQLLASALAALDGGGRLATIGILPLLAADVLGPSLAGISFAGSGLAGVTIAASVAALIAIPLLFAAIRVAPASAAPAANLTCEPAPAPSPSAQ